MAPVFRGQWRNLLRMDHGPLGPNPNEMHSRLRHCPRNTGSIHDGGTMRSETALWKSFKWVRNYRWVVLYY